MLLNSVLQLIFSHFRNNSYTSLFNSSTESTLLKCLLQTAHNACNSKDVRALKFQLVHHDTLYNGQIQQDSAECLLMLIGIINKGSMPDSSTTTYSAEASLSDILFSFVLEKYIICDVCGLRPPSFESRSVLYITPTDTSSMQDLIFQGMQQKLQKSCSDVIRTLGTSNQAIYYNLQNICFSSLIDTNTLTIMLFSLRASIDHHGPSIHSDHYTTSINCGNTYTYIYMYV